MAKVSSSVWGRAVSAVAATGVTVVQPATIACLSVSDDHSDRDGARRAAAGAASGDAPVVEDGSEEVLLLTMENESSTMAVEVCSYGASVVQIRVPDRDGCLGNVVLGFDGLAGYAGEPPHPFLGCTVGRVCNRIRAGKFSLDGRDYELEINDPPNHLHGGRAMDRRVWTTAAVGPGARVCFRTTSPHMECGYPGVLDCTCTYTLTDDNALIIDYDCSATQAATPCW